MTVIRPNSVSGITSITAQANEINFFRSNGTLAGLQLNGVNFNTTAGISTLAALKVTGNLDVEGVLTYQDVTNVDSLGIGTFRTGINVSGGQLDVGSNIKLGNAGVITATTFVGAITTTDACQVGDLTILNGNPDLKLKDSNHAGNNTEHMIAFQDSSGNNQMNIGSPFGEQHLRIKYGTNQLVKIQTDGKIGIGTDNPKQNVSINNGRVSIDVRGDYYGAWIDGDTQGTSSFNVGRWHNAGGRMRSGGSNDNDLVVETQNTAHNLQLQPSGGLVFIGTTNPINTSPSKFQVAANDATGSAIFSRFNASVYSSYLDFYKSRSNTLGTAYVVNDGDHLGSLRFYGADGSNSGYTTAAEIYGSCDGGSGSSGDMPGRITFHTRPDGAGQAMTERMRITKEGYITKPYQPAFLAHNNGSYASNGTINSNSVIDFFRSTKFNRGNHYNTSNGYFVVPVSGVYYFNAVLSVRSSNVGVQIGYTVNSTSASGLYYGGTDVLVFEAHINGLSAGHPNGAMLMDLSAGDIVRLFNRSATFTCGRHHSWWMGYLIG